MSIFDSLFGKHEAIAPAHAEAAIPPAVTARAVSYDPDLVPRLRLEHVTLERLLNEMRESHARKNFAALERALHKFQLTLSLHLAAEHNEFYSYLGKNLQKGSDAHATLATSFAEMQDLGRAVSGFVEKFNVNEFTPELHTAFGMHFEIVAPALLKRIKHEEDKLYGLYAPA